MNRKCAGITCLCELMDSPIGIDCKKPEFSWKIGDGIYGKQISYRIQVSRSQYMTENVWDSGVIFSEQNCYIKYQGKSLQSGTKYYYTVEVETEKREKLISEINYFVTGILETVSWEENWIGGASVRSQSYLIRWPFTLKQKPVTVAAFIVSPNYIHVSFNGKSCRDLYLGTPSEYKKTLYYDTYLLDADIGENVLGVEIGNGWYAMELAERGIAKNEHICAIKIRVEYEKGNVEWLSSTPEECYCTSQTPSIRNSIYTGEYTDNRLRKIGFDKNDYIMKEEDGWRRVFQQDSPGGEIIGQMMEPIRIEKMLEPMQTWILPDGSITIDFGQNFAGWARLTVCGSRGECIIVRYAEIAYKDHALNDSSYNGIHISDTYILSGEEREILEPRFSYRGFRFINIQGLSDLSKLKSIQGCVVHSDVKCIGDFLTDHRILNQFYKNALWTEKSNLQGMPTDCPQRAERVAWLNDMTVRAECALYHYRLPRLYKKWMRDIRDCQGKVSGAITDTAPFFRNGQKPADPVSTSFLLVPWLVYCFYGDVSIIKDNYEACKKWVDYLKRHSDNYIVRYSPMGDWASPRKWCDRKSIGAGAVSKITPTVFMATGYLYYNYQLLKKMAGILKLSEEQKLFENEAKAVKEAFFEEYYNAEEGYFCTNSQACNAFPLYLGMMDDSKEKQKVLSHLVEDVRKNGHHLTTGNLCSKYVIEVLFQNGYMDDAMALLTQTSYPSWGYMIENGATTLWERWEKVDTYHGISNMASLNHAMIGAVTSSFYRYLVGIRPDEEQAGFRNAIVRPIMPEKLKIVKGSIQTMNGKYSCQWIRDDRGNIQIEIDIPFNCTADIYLPIKNKGWSEKGIRLEECVEFPEGKYVHLKCTSGKKVFISMETDEYLTE